MDFLKDIVKQIGSEYASLASDIVENEKFVDTGSYIFNALLSGSIYGGVSQNKITTLAGETSTGKCARGTERISIYTPYLHIVNSFETKFNVTQSWNEQRALYKIDLTYQQLYEYYGEGKHEVPYAVEDNILIELPNGGFTQIDYVVTKHKNQVIRLTFDDGDKFECSINHTFLDYYTGLMISALQAKHIQSIHGRKEIVKRENIGEESVYDISIPHPHWYVANRESGIIHHNTYFSLAVVKNFLEQNPDAYCLYFDTESAITKKLLESRNIDINRVVVINVVTVEEFRTKALKAVDLYLKTPEEKRKQCLIILDSLGMLSTNKEIGDALAEKDARDMTRTTLLKGAFRMLTLKLGQANIPMIVTNHLYSNIGGYGPTHKQSGGSGSEYAASSIVYLSKSKEKDGTEVVGNIIRAKSVKSRLSCENREVEIRLFYDHRGLDRYYGLIELGEESGIIPRVGNRYEINGKKLGRNQILNEPELHFTPELLDQLDEYAKKKFAYGSNIEDVETEELDGED